MGIYIDPNRFYLWRNPKRMPSIEASAEAPYGFNPLWEAFPYFRVNNF